MCILQCLSYSTSITCFFLSENQGRTKTNYFYVKIYIYIYVYLISAFFQKKKIQVISIQYDGGGRSSRAEWKSLHDFTGCYRGDELQRDLCVRQDVLGVAGSLLDVGEDEGGPARRGDDAVRGPRGFHRGHHGAARVHAFFVLVSFNVLRQVVAPHETLGTFRADKLLLSCHRQNTV